ncbi:N-acetylglutamate synthase;glutamate N-acetyltransferase [Candidatus Moduliflexus flocculans]|uniref:Arginine biosynthesis bifunctional protein ArgJ n=1 Tax=Candidatus Moduliflexus flocculans TaxID=1499966 RepID=A0A081BPU0_9BACT|nr:N-acetylglutamate synthase;glutamate N-acetyltransferase [Candidatus Moduliflexus flocculans]
MRVIEGGVTAAAGFTAAGVNCGIKTGRNDFAMVASDIPASAAAMFTTNKVAAAPVVFDKEQLTKTSFISAIVANCGVANACTGERGLQDARDTAAKVSDTLKVKGEQVLVCSTGVIGSFLPMENILKGVELAAAQLSRDGHLDAAKAIMTTDTKSKEIAVEVETAKPAYRIGGMAKGSGMMKPNMATMLVFLTTDANLQPETLNLALRQAVEVSFHRISVDNDTSTNDTVILLANGECGGEEILPDTPEFQEFCDALKYVCIELAKMLVRDGEGTTKLIEIQIKHAASDADALTGARAVADSYLVKTAINGGDPNWGRIIAALGYAGIALTPEKVTLHINGAPILQENFQQPGTRAELRKLLATDTIVIVADLGIGDGQCTFWTSDLSNAYVDINAKYTT